MTFDKTEVQLDVDLSEIGVVIPAFNAEKTISDLVKELLVYGFKKENIIVVNDGSNDRTDEVVTKLGLSVVTHNKNIGKGAALKHGFDTARAKNLKNVFTLDADGQHKVSEINNFLKLKGHYDLIIGSRNNVADMPYLRRIVNRTTSLVVSLLSQKYVPDVQCGFRYVNLNIFSKVKLETNNYQTESEMVVKTVRNRYAIESVPISTLYQNEKSYINAFTDTIRFIKMAIGFLWR